VSFDLGELSKLRMTLLMAQGKKQAYKRKKNGQTRKELNEE